MTMGIAAVGAAILTVVEQAGEPLPSEERWLLVGATVIVLLSIALLMRTIQVAKEWRQVYRSSGRVHVLSSTLIVFLGFTNLGTIPSSFWVLEDALWPLQ